MPDLPLFDDDGSEKKSTFSRAVGAARQWATTEIGGWVIVGSLVVVALLVTATVLVTRTGVGTSGVPTETYRMSAAQAELGDVGELTITPDTIQDLTPEGARAWNANLPFSTAPNNPAGPFIAPSDDAGSYGRALDCLTAAIYYEAGFEPADGQAAVAQVVLNRVRHPAFPHTVCGVVFQGSDRVTGCQFTFTCDGALTRPPAPEAWDRARGVATAALNGRVMQLVGTATHYHADFVAPVWAPRLAKIVQIRAHIFYRWAGAWGFKPAFTGAYRGGEPVIEKMAHLSTAIVALDETLLVFPDLGEMSPRIEVPSLAENEADRIPLVATPTETQTAEISPAPIAVNVTAPIRRTVPDADPMSNPAAPSAQREQNRPRIPAPSGW